MLHAKYSLLCIFVFFLGCAPKTLLGQEIQPSRILDLPVMEIRDNFLPYKEFCLRNVGECDLSGQSLLELRPAVWHFLLETNSSVNSEISLRSDRDEYQREEFWTYPSNGFGDCEDIALEKRRRLVKIGLPRGPLRLAIVHHKRNLAAHAVLTVETCQGTFVMDSTHDQILLWYTTPYNFETRERTDSRWERFDQDTWAFYE